MRITPFVFGLIGHSITNSNSLTFIDNSMRVYVLPNGLWTSGRSNNDLWYTFREEGEHISIEHRTMRIKHQKRVVGIYFTHFSRSHRPDGPSIMSTDETTYSNNGRYFGKREIKGAKYYYGRYYNCPTLIYYTNYITWAMSSNGHAISFRKDGPMTIYTHPGDFEADSSDSNDSYNRKS